MARRPYALPHRSGWTAHVMLVGTYGLQGVAVWGAGAQKSLDVWVSCALIRVRPARRQAQVRFLQIFTSYVPLDFDTQGNGMGGQRVLRTQRAETSIWRPVCGAEIGGAENERYITCKKLQKRTVGLPSSRSTRQHRRYRPQRRYASEQQIVICKQYMNDIIINYEVYSFTYGSCYLVYAPRVSPYTR